MQFISVDSKSAVEIAADSLQRFRVVLFGLSQRQEYVSAVVFVEQTAFGQSFQQVLDVLWHLVRPVDNVPVFGNFREEEFSVSTDVGRLVLPGEQYSPGFDHESSDLREGSYVGGRRDLDFWKGSMKFEGGQVKSQELEGVVGILEEGFGVEVDVFE